MSLREWILAGLLAVAGAFIVVGLFKLADPAGWIGAGVLFGAWTWITFADDGRRTVEADA